MESASHAAPRIRPSRTRRATVDQSRGRPAAARARDGRARHRAGRRARSRRCVERDAELAQAGAGAREPRRRTTKSSSTATASRSSPCSSRSRTTCGWRAPSSRIGRELERAGDEAKKIARFALSLDQANDGDPVLAVARQSASHGGRCPARCCATPCGRPTRWIPALARSVLERDAELDAEFAAALRQVMSYVLQDHRFLRPTIDTIFALKGLERIGDHATNVAEQVLYMLGQDAPAGRRGLSRRRSSRGSDSVGAAQQFVDARPWRGSARRRASRSRRSTSPYLPLAAGSVPGTTTAPAGMRP